MTTPAPEPAPTPDPAAEANPETPTAEPAPPWGDDFDPQRAWHTITTLREREKELSKGQISDEQQKQLDEYNALVEASKSEAQRQSEAAETAKREAETARADAIRYKAAATFNIPAEHFDLLGTGTEDEITARAEKLQALLTAQTPPATPAVPGRPVEQMRPGATPAEPDNEDDVIYQRLFGSPAR